MKHRTPSSAAKAVRILLRDGIAKTWTEYFDGEHRTNAYGAALLVQEQVRGCDFRSAMLAVQEAMPELFAEYWEVL